MVDRALSTGQPGDQPGPIQACFNVVLAPFDFQSLCYLVYLLYLLSPYRGERDLIMERTMVRKEREMRETRHREDNILRMVHVLALMMERYTNAHSEGEDKENTERTRAQIALNLYDRLRWIFHTLDFTSPRL